MALHKPLSIKVRILLRVKAQSFDTVSLPGRSTSSTSLIVLSKSTSAIFSR
eukprot:SAG31_NODE_4320_length_3361_cov_5.376150_3_plen_51_part_00